jgi:Protein of unknown function (DUF3293)
MKKKSSEHDAGSDGNYMTKQNLWLLHRMSQMLYKGIPHGMLLPDWAESKINSAAQHLKEVAGWAMYESHGDDLHPPPEENPIHLGERHLRAGLIRLAHSKPSLRPHLLPLLREASLDKTALKVKEMKRLLDDPRKQFGVLTAQLGGVGSGVNTRANEDLVRDLQKLGYNKFVPLKASWEGVGEKSFLVPDMSFRDAIALGMKYKQQAVIYKDPSGTLGVYYPAEGMVEVAADPQGDIAADIATDKSQYSKARGLSFSFGVLWGQKMPWSMSRPVTQADLQEMMASGQLSV